MPSQTPPIQNATDASRAARSLSHLVRRFCLGFLSRSFVLRSCKLLFQPLRRVVLSCDGLGLARHRRQLGLRSRNRAALLPHGLVRIVNILKLLTPLVPLAICLLNVRCDLSLVQLVAGPLAVHFLLRGLLGLKCVKGFLKLGHFGLRNIRG